MPLAECSAMAGPANCGWSRAGAGHRVWRILAFGRRQEKRRVAGVARSYGGGRMVAVGVAGVARSYGGGRMVAVGVAGMARSYGGGQMVVVRVAGMAPYGEQTSRLAEHAVQRINNDRRMVSMVSAAAVAAPLISSPMAPITQRSASPKTRKSLMMLTRVVIDRSGTVGRCPSCQVRECRAGPRDFLSKARGNASWLEFPEVAPRLRRACPLQHSSALNDAKDDHDDRDDQ